jgi:hypothetical protein
MSVKITLSELKGMEIPLTKLLEQHLPVKTSFRLSKVLREISKEIQDLEDQREKLIRQFGEVDGSSISIKDPAKLLAFQQEFGDLLKEEVEFDYSPISIESLGENVNLTVAEITVLSVLFTD